MFLKAGRPYIAGKWFCSDECAETDPETKKIIEMMELDGEDE